VRRSTVSQWIVSSGDNAQLDVCDDRYPDQLIRVAANGRGQISQVKAGQRALPPHAKAVGNVALPLSNRRLSDFAEHEGEDNLLELDIDLVHENAASTDEDFARHLRQAAVRSRGDADDDDDPFAALQESELTLATQAVEMIRSQHIEEILLLTKWLKLSSPESSVLPACRKLGKLFRDHPSLKSILITHHKIITIIELLDSPNQRVLHAVLQARARIYVFLCVRAGVGACASCACVGA
jgi:hypothetical protein